ncbi:hypothetical protein B1F79_03485 [Coxiella-like endosymbiont of Rhipicephalus sanguineus]|nr:hypothetical protein [Coxiella-like endosymbiont of Rhipicephalus sanguineus]
MTEKINGPLRFTKYMNDEAGEILGSDIVGYLSFFKYYRDSRDPRYSRRKEAITFLVLIAKKCFH